MKKLKSYKYYTIIRLSDIRHSDEDGEDYMDYKGYLITNRYSTRMSYKNLVAFEDAIRAQFGMHVGYMEPFLFPTYITAYLHFQQNPELRNMTLYNDACPESTEQFVNA